MKFLQRREAKVVALLSLAALGFTAPKLAVRQRVVDPAQSTVTVHTGKTGFIKALGHDHWFTAHISKGSITEGTNAEVTFTVEAHDLVMVPDTRINAKDSAKIMNTTLNKVLEVDKYPEITFESNSVKSTGPNQWFVTGGPALARGHEACFRAGGPERGLLLRHLGDQADRFRNETGNRCRRDGACQERDRGHVQGSCVLGGSGIVQSAKAD